VHGRRALGWHARSIDEVSILSGKPSDTQWPSATPGQDCAEPMEKSGGIVTISDLIAKLSRYPADARVTLLERDVISLNRRGIPESRGF
jgi:hypothetical protein